MYRCKIVYSDDDITIIRSKRILFLLFLLPVVFLMLFVPFYYSIIFLLKQSIIYRAVFYFIIWGVIIAFVLYYFYEFLLCISSIEIELKNESIRIKQTILGKIIHNSSYPLLILYPLKKDISANQCSLKFKDSGLTIQEYSELKELPYESTRRWIRMLQKARQDGTSASKSLELIE